MANIDCSALFNLSVPVHILFPGGDFFLSDPFISTANLHIRDLLNHSNYLAID